MKVTKAVFPVAGLGTRFLPATKASPKEMIPIIDKPLIQFAVEEAISAGITELIFITSNKKYSIEAHFDTNLELEELLLKRKDFDMLKLVHNVLPKNITCTYIKQGIPNGLGHAVLCAKSIVADEPFAVLLPDELIEADEQSCLQQMLKSFDQQQSTIIAIQEVPKNETKNYGIVSLDDTHKIISRINYIVEKPSPDVAPSNFAVVGRYIFTPSIFKFLEIINKNNTDQEIRLTDAISKQLEHEDVFAFQFQGNRYDCGNKLGYIEAIIAYGLRQPELKKEVNQLLKKYLSKIPSHDL